MRYSYAWDLDGNMQEGERVQDLDAASLAALAERYVTVRNAHCHLIWAHDRFTATCLRWQGKWHACWVFHELASSGSSPGSPLVLRGRLLRPSEMPSLRDVTPVPDDASKCLALVGGGSRFHPASVAGLVVGAMGCFIFGLYLRSWLRERKALASQPQRDMIA
jgi:hypothetical protein